MLRFGADGDGVLARDRETRDRMFPPIEPAIDSGLRTRSRCATTAHYSNLRLYAQRRGLDPTSVRCPENSCSAGAAPARKETTRHRSQDRHAMALCVRKSFPDRANSSAKSATAESPENRRACGELSYPRPQAR